MIIKFKESNNNDNKKSSCLNLISQYNINSNYVNKLKEENEILKKELKESNEKISFLMNQIKELKENKSYKSKKYVKNKIGPPNILDKSKFNFEIYDKENYNSCNINENKKISKYKSKSNLFKSKNNIYNKVKIKINKRYNINNNKKINDNNNPKTSFSDKPSEKINKCISQIKI